MASRNKIIATKFLKDGTKQGFEGEFSELASDLFAGLMPLAPSDRFVIELGEEVDPVLLMSFITLKTEQSREKSWPAPDLEAWINLYSNDQQFILTNWLTGYPAFVLQENSCWQLAGFNVGGATYPVLVNQEEFYFPNSRYASKRVLASLQIHSDGGGAPVSWDESHALLDLGKHLIHSRGGDLDEADELWFKPDNMIASIAYWLDETNALSLFLFTYFQPKWENEDLVARFTQILEALKEFASIEIDLTPDEIIRLTKFILNKFEYAKTLFDLLAVNQSLKTYRLTDLVEEAVNSGSPTSVTNLEFLVSELNQDENY